MSTSNKTDNGSGLMQFIVPALVGAGVSAAAFALFLTLGPDRMRAPSRPSPSQPPAQISGLDESQRTLIENTVEAYLIRNPQILMKMSEELERQQGEERLTQVKTTISQSADKIYRDNYGLEAGNPQGDVTVVEFSDYNCPYCKRAFSDLSKLIESDGNVRVVLKEFPIFGERSEGAARVAIAAGKQGKYFDLHAELLKNRGQNNEKTALQFAEKLGLDMDKLREDANSGEVRDIIKETRELGNRLGIQGTPFYLVGDKVIPGAPENLLDVFKQNVADIRKNGCAVGC